MTDEMRLRTNVTRHKTPSTIFDKVKARFGLESLFNDDRTSEWIRLDLPEARASVTWFKAQPEE